ncbi:hypothetical protein [Streptomyces sp. NPDC054834]
MDGIDVLCGLWQATFDVLLIQPTLAAEVAIAAARDPPGAGATPPLSTASTDLEPHDAPLLDERSGPPYG